MTNNRDEEKKSRTILGAKFRRLREHFGYSRPAYADILGMSLGNMRTIEAGTSTCSSVIIQRIRKNPQLSPYVLWLVDDNDKDIDYPTVAQTMDQPIYKDLITTIVEAIEETITKNKCDLSSEKKGELIYILYCQAVKAGKVDAIDWESISMLIEFTLNNK